MRKLIIGWLLVIGIVSVGRACEHCAALAVGNVVPAKVKYFGLKDVRLLDSPFKNAMDRNAAWMLEMDMDRLLSNFLKNAGLEPKGESYGSWEFMGIPWDIIFRLWHNSMPLPETNASNNGWIISCTNWIVASNIL